MLVLSKRIYYAVEAVLYIAYHAKGSPIAGTEVAEAQGLATRYLEPMMQKLVRAGILRGMRGPQGGYTLGRERRRITLGDICTALEGKNQLPDTITPLGQKVLRQTAGELLANWQQQLSTITIEDLCGKAQSVKIAAPKTTTSFAI